MLKRSALPLHVTTGRQTSLIPRQVRAGMRSVARWVLTLAPPRGGDGVMTERKRSLSTVQDDKKARAAGLGINPSAERVDREEDWVGYDAFLGNHQPALGRTKVHRTVGTAGCGQGVAETAETAGEKLEAGVSSLGTSAHRNSFSAESLHQNRDRDTLLRPPASIATTSDYYRGYSAAWDYRSQVQEWKDASHLGRFTSATLLGIFALAIFLSALGGFVLGRATG